ncbi:MAG: 30S ribosomal protein S7 [Promethearchaeota archaeon Loki_b32]|nr:MAG: 30S ribosomal protein S7 [Candidatus Lokiarchaeota archaeon Loki_b32]
MSKTKKEIKLFNKWAFEDIKIKDRTLENYINLKPIIVPHSAGRHEHKRFWKSSKVSVIERFSNRLLSPGFIGNKIRGRKSSYNSGKKNKLLKSLENAFTLIELITEQNPIQVLVDGICNSAPREETTRIALGGIRYASAVDIAPQRRVDLAIKYLAQAIGARSHSNVRQFGENLAQELMLAANSSQESRAIKRKDEIERIAVSAR